MIQERWRRIHTGARRTAFVGLILLLTLVLAACGGGGGAPGGAKQGEGGTLVIATSSFPNDLDPASEYDVTNSALVQNLYDRLVEYKVLEKNGKPVGTAEIVPSLAKTWKVSSDGLVWTFQLRQDAKFHDGSPVNAQAVVYSLQRAIRMKLGPSWILLQNLDTNSIRATGPYEVQMTLKHPYGAFLATLATDVASIVNPKVVEAHGGVRDGANNEWMSSHDAGSGPFYVKEIVVNQRVILARFDQYWKGPAKIQEAAWEYVKEPSNQELFLKTGQADIALQVPLKDMADLAKDPNVQVLQAPSINIFYIAINTQRKPFNDVRVRQALNYAINKENLIRYVQFGYGRQLKSPIPEGMPGYDPSFWHYEYNPEKAKQLLAQAGYPNGFSTSIYLSASYADWQQVATLMQADLQKIGVKLDIKTYAGPTWRSLRDKGEAPMVPITWYPDYNDPDDYVYPLLSGSNVGAGGNWSFYRNTQLDRLMEQAKVEQDSAKRMELYKEVQQIAVEDAPWIFMYQVDNVIGMRKSVENYVMYPISYLLNLHEITKT